MQENSSLIVEETDSQAEDLEQQDPEYADESTEENEDEGIGQETSDTPGANQQEQEPGTDPPTDGYLKIIITTRQGKTLIGVERTYSDPYLEPVDSQDIDEIASVLPDTVQRAHEHWDTNPKNPAYYRPDAPKKRKSTTRPQADSTSPGATQPAPAKPESVEIIATPTLL